MNTELTVQEAALAWAQKKKVLAAPEGSINWNSITPVGGGDGYYTANVFTEDKVQFRFRLAPEPPAKKWRPWTEDEVPVGVKFRENGCTGWFTATCAGNGEIETLIEGVDEQVSLKELFDNHVHSLDNGKTWLPCGVEVSE